jgi:hypothetical protein
MGDSSFCAPTFVGPLSPDQTATCANEQLNNIKNFYYQAGQDNASVSTGITDPLPSLAIGPIPGFVSAGLGFLLLLSFLPKGRR